MINVSSTLNILLRHVRSLIPFVIVIPNTRQAFVNPLPPEWIIFYSYLETISSNYRALNEEDLKKLIEHFVENKISYKFTKKLVLYFHFLTKIFESKYGLYAWVKNDPSGDKGLNTGQAGASWRAAGQDENFTLGLPCTTGHQDSRTVLSCAQLCLQPLI